jgi:hypothetical protein
VLKFYLKLLLVSFVVAACSQGGSTGSTGSTEILQFNDVAVVGQPFAISIPSLLSHPVFALTNAPEGMTINAVTGQIYWTPTQNQSGSYVVNVDVSGTTKTLNLTVNTGAFNTGTAIFISPNGVNTNSGTFDAPLHDTKSLCASTLTVLAGTTIYYRGGVYHNPGFGIPGNLNNKSIPQVDCSGMPNNPVILKPWGNEKPKIEFDSFIGMRLVGNYMTFEGFEVQGVGKKITYTEAVNTWWSTPQYYNGNGIVINGHHTTVRNNIVYDIPASAISANGNVDYFVADGNIVYDSAWWTIKGTKGIGVVNANTSDGTTSQNIKIINNLVFGVESRIFSRVWSKGLAKLTIDEGEAILVQVNNGTYRGRYLVQNNFMLHNGKGVVINKTNNADIYANTLYMNGTTISGKSKGIRANSTNSVVVQDNAVEVSTDANSYAYSVAKSTLTTHKNNYLVGGDTLAKNYVALTGNNFVSFIFNNPATLDFSILPNLPQNIGASQAVWATLKARADEYGIVIKTTGYVPDYRTQTIDVKNGIPAGTLIDTTTKVGSWLLSNIPTVGVTDGRPAALELIIVHP